MSKISYAGYRFPPEIIQKAIWLYVRFTLSFRDVEDLLTRLSQLGRRMSDFRVFCVEKASQYNER
jgi:transposase-like protein